MKLSLLFIVLFTSKTVIATSNDNNERLEMQKIYLELSQEIDNKTSEEIIKHKKEGILKQTGIKNHSSKDKKYIELLFDLSQEVDDQTSQKKNITANSNDNNERLEMQKIYLELCQEIDNKTSQKNNITEGKDNNSQDLKMLQSKDDQEKETLCKQSKIKNNDFKDENKYNDVTKIIKLLANEKNIKFWKDNDNYLSEALVSNILLEKEETGVLFIPQDTTQKNAMRLFTFLPEDRQTVIETPLIFVQSQENKFYPVINPYGGAQLTKKELMKLGKVNFTADLEEAQVLFTYSQNTVNEYPFVEIKKFFRY